MSDNTINFKEERAIFVNEELTIEGAGKFVQMMYHMSENSADPIFIVINSKGGNIRALMTMISAIEVANCDITTIDVGCAASCAAILFLQGKKRLIVKGAEIMFHQPLQKFSNDLYSYSEIVEIKEALKKDYEFFITEFISKTNFTRKKIISKIKNKNYVLGCDEALKTGVATQIISSVSELK